MELIEWYKEKHPEIKLKLKKARWKKTPEEYIKQTFFAAGMFSFFVVVIVFLFTRGNIGFFGILITLVLSYILLFQIMIRRVDARINKLKKEIDREIVYAGRFLLIKLSAGRPLLNTIIDASKSYGNCSKYFKEIAKEVELGTPIEEALQKAILNSPSQWLRRILFQINSALRVGIDVTKFLEATIDEIVSEQLIEVKRYGKKLNSITLLYLLLGIIAPTLGLAITSIVGTLVGLQISGNFFTMMILFVLIVQVMFMLLFKAMRPNVEV